MGNYVYKGDVGIELVFDTGITDEIIENKIYYVKPDRTTGFWEGEVIEEGKIKYITQMDDLNQVGTYKLQVYIRTDNFEVRSDIVSLYVKDNI